MTRTRWRAAFLSVTALAIVLELVAVLDGRPDTEPWTDLIVTYVPMEVTALAVAGLSGWLAVHFGVRYWRRRRPPSS